MVEVRKPKTLGSTVGCTTKNTEDIENIRIRDGKNTVSQEVKPAMSQSDQEITW